jgi:hypothetical protein
VQWQSKDRSRGNEIAENRRVFRGGFSGAGFQVGIKVLTGENIPLSKVYGD